VNKQTTMMFLFLKIFEIVDMQNCMWYICGCI